MTGNPTSQLRHQHNVHLADVHPRPAIFDSFERARHRQAHWLIECLAEMFGVFCYCYAGIGATAAYVVGNILKLGLGSVLTVGLAYGIGIVVAVVVCTATSGGHFSPAVTLVHIIFNKFPVAKGVRYVIAQILGGFIASWFVYWQWNTLIKDAEAALKVAGLYEAENFSSLGPAGIFALYANPAAPLGQVFLNEFVSDIFIGIVIAACLDPTNFFAPPVAVPWIVGMTYATAIWGFSSNGLVLNTARDLGGRLVAIAIWGTKASGGRYAAIAALTNIIATVLAFAFYEIVLKDSSRVLTSAGKEFYEGRAAHMKHRDTTSIMLLYDTVQAQMLRRRVLMMLMWNIWRRSECVSFSLHSSEETCNK
ncbi:aquaporin-like protein [Multifurca ochricompacta]|uniref:Aquaporin-like protein n=1 Tax=Multifurca ochricompacta TaxID=376703 RepID=A0AAD4M6L1_9AGAM|nr:aquaporin-like protein [Multifurca ochricompacta]